MENNECCENCKFCKDIEIFDYKSDGGCDHIRAEGFACLAYTDDGTVIHMKNVDKSIERCEMFIENNRFG